MNKSIKTRTCYSIVGSDYSAQEPRSLASFSHDTEMLKAYDEGKDLYAVIGSKCFHVDYEDCLEFDPRQDGKLNQAGKARRSKAKAVLLGISYGMSAASLAERLECSKEEAESIINGFYEGFPGVKKFTEDSQNMLRTKGYVTDMWGRKRRIEDAMLPDFEVSVSKFSDNVAFNPLLHCTSQHADKETEALIQEYKNRLSIAKWKKDIDAIKSEADKNGIYVKDNRGFINKALRQCLNARIQGTAASMTKVAMIAIDKDPILNDLNCHLIITVHDEVLAEVPRENSEKASKRLAELMVAAAKTKCSCKFKCDPYEVARWYEDELAGECIKEYSEAIEKKHKSPEEAFEIVYNKYEMINKTYLKQMCEGTYECNTHVDI